MATGKIKSYPSEADIFQTLGDWLKDVAPEYTIMQGQQNRVRMPDPPLIVFQVVTRHRVGTNTHIEHEGGKKVTVIELLEMAIQLQTFGPQAGDDCIKFGMLWRDEHACDFFSKHLQALPSIPNGYDGVRPLYSTDPIQHQFISSEKEFLDNWSTDLHLNINRCLEMDYQSATKLKLKELNAL